MYSEWRFIDEEEEMYRSSLCWMDGAGYHLSCCDWMCDCECHGDY